MQTNNLYLGDCLNVMKDFSDGLFDMILCDPPFGTTCLEWDSAIDFSKMWVELKRISKSNAAILLFAANPFDKPLACSNIEMYKYDWIWLKEQGSGQLNSKKQPLRKHENILVFYKKQPIYNPQFTQGKPYSIKRNIKTEGLLLYNGIAKETETISNGDRYPTSELRFNRELSHRYHPTQKPVLLLEYLINTYTNDGMKVLDFTMGSGSTGVACKYTNRDFYGIEKEERYFNIAKKRIEEGLL